MRRLLRTRGALSWAAFAVVVLLSFVVLFLPGPDVPPAPYGSDKLVHGGLFLALAFTGSWAGLRRGVVAVALPGYAAASELIQTIPALHRDGSVWDWVADVVGVLLGLLVWSAAGRRLFR